MSERAGHPAHDIIVRARQTQCCDPIIDGVLGSLIEECENLRSRIEALTAECSKWNELRRVIAEILGCNQETWPDHGNAPLAIAASYQLLKQDRDHTKSELADTRAVVRFLQVSRTPQATEASAEFYRETLQMVLDLLNPLHGSLDLQVTEQFTDERDLDPPSDREYAVTVTRQMERDLTQAVTILENRIRAAP